MDWGDFGFEFVTLTPLTANKVMQELISSQILAAPQKKWWQVWK